MSYYLNPGLPRPAPAPDGLDKPFWEGLAQDELWLQKCEACGRFQWGPEWLCHRCHGDQLVYEQVEPTGIIYSYERVWHPVHPALREQGPYLVVLVEIPHADQVRLVGNLLGDPVQKVQIGGSVEAFFEHHTDVEAGFSLLQWRARTST